MENKIKKIIIGGIATGIMGGSILVGSEIGRPECDYVIIKDREYGQGICLTKEQARAVAEYIQMFPSESCGLGGLKMESTPIDIIKK